MGHGIFYDPSYNNDLCMRERVLPLLLVGMRPRDQTMSRIFLWRAGRATDIALSSQQVFVSAGRVQKGSGRHARPEGELIDTPRPRD